MRYRSSPALVALVLVLLASTGVALGAKPATAPLQFDDKGAQVGEQLPNLPAHELDGTTVNLRSLWSNRGVLLLTSSLTCPKSRSTYPRAEAMAAEVKDALPVEIIYVLEAHPKGDPSPYRGYEDVTPENRRDGVLCPQPKTLAERLKLAERFKSKLHAKCPIHVDGMDNAVWSALGGGPNMGVLVDTNGIVIARQGWFDAASMRKAIDAFVAAAKQHRNGQVQTPADKDLDATLNAAHLEPWQVAMTFQRGDVEAATKLLHDYPQLANYTTEVGRFTHGQTLLAYAAEGKDNASIVQLLLSHGARVNAQNTAAASALSMAAKAGDARVVSLLIAHGADVNLAAAAGPTPLQEAVIHGHREVVDLLLKAGAKQNRFYNAAAGRVDEVRQELVEDPTRALRPDGWGRSLLDYAAANGQLGVIKLLVSYGVREDPVDPQDHYTDRAIHWAARQHQTAAVALLLDAGDDVNATGEDEETILHIAALTGSADLVRAVAPRRPNFAALNMWGYAPLHMAAELGATDVAAAMLRAGADPNVGTGPNHAPCGPFEPEAPLETALELAAQNARPKMIRLLLANGAAVNQKDHSGATSLHAAASAAGDAVAPERLESVRLLIDQGAEVNARDDQGRKPLDVVPQNEAMEPLIQLLEKHGAKRSVPSAG